MTGELVTGLVIVIMALCQAVKLAGLPSRFIPLLAVLLGISGAVLMGGGSWLMIAAGVFTGLSSSGTYDFIAKTIFNKQ